MMAFFNQWSDYFLLLFTERSVYVVNINVHSHLENQHMNSGGYVFVSQYAHSG